MSNAEGYVLPKPGIPKTLGILNIIFGVILVLLGLCGIASLAAAPAMFQGLEKIGKDVQAKQEEQQKAKLKTYDDRIAAAKTDEEKAEIEKEKANDPASQIQMNPVDVSAAADTFKNPTIMIASYVGALTGLILHIILLTAGIGLIRLAAWGRSLSLWWAGLQIVQVLLVLYGNLVYVLPANQAMMAKQFEKMPRAAPGAPDPAQIMKISMAMQVPMTVGTAIGGMIYPVILLIMLNNAGARAACLAKKPTNIDDI